MTNDATKVASCDYHDLPLVCRECGTPWSDEFATMIHAPPHPFRPVHRWRDPENYELDTLMPCTETNE